MIERKGELTASLRDLLHPLVNTMTAVKPRFREIQESDVEAVADLLTRGFVHRSRDYWMAGLRRQGARTMPQDAPRYGYLIENTAVPSPFLLRYAWHVPAGHVFRIVTIDGPQVGDLNIWNLHNPRERMWASRSRQGKVSMAAP